MVIFNDRRQVKRDVAGFVKLSHLSVRPQQKLATRLQAALGPKFAEVANALRRAIDVSFKFESAT